MEDRNDSIDAAAEALAGIMWAFGSTTAELIDGMARFAKALIAYRGKVKHRHPRHKQIERARAMMECGQKGK